MISSTTKSVERNWRWFSNFMLLIMVAWTLIPFYWMFATSIKKHKEIYGREVSLWPNDPTLDSYRAIFFDTEYFTFFWNSMTVAMNVTVITLVCSTLAAYAIARLEFPGRSLLARGMIYTYLMPQSLLFIPLLSILLAVGLNNSLFGLSLAHLGFTIPFCTWLLIGFFQSVPAEVEEAALVDGCTRLGALVRVVLPMSLPALAVVAFFSFTLSWNEFLYSTVFNTDPSVRTIPTGLSAFIIEDVFNWGPIMGSAIITVIPPLFVYFIFQRFLVTGLTMGAIKG